MVRIGSVGEMLTRMWAVKGEGCSPEKNLNKHQYQWKKPDEERFFRGTRIPMLKTLGKC
jgi:hypothetical protein